MQNETVDLETFRLQASIDREFAEVPTATRTAMSFEECATKGTLPLLFRYEARLSAEYHRAMKTLLELKENTPLAPPGPHPRYRPQEVPDPKPAPVAFDASTKHEPAAAISEAPSQPAKTKNKTKPTPQSPAAARTLEAVSVANSTHQSTATPAAPINAPLSPCREQPVSVSKHLQLGTQPLFCASMNSYMSYPALAVALLGATAIAAQQPGQQVLRTERNEVVLDIVARDKHGRLIRDLRPSELHISDEGTAVQPAGFRLVASGSDTTTQESSSKKGRQPRLITFVFEQFGPEGRIVAREGALALLKAAEQSDVYFSVFSVAAGTKLIEPFTKDSDLAKRAIESVTTGARRNLVSTPAQSPTGAHSQDDQSLDSGKPGAWADGEHGTEAILSRMISNAIDPSVAIGMRAARSAPALQALLALARSQGMITARKTLVYFCEGLQVAESQRQQFRAIVDAANRANMSIYPVDVSGLDYQMASAGNQLPLPSLQTGQKLPITGTNHQISRGGDIAAPLNARARDLRVIDSMDLEGDGSRSSMRNALFDLATNTGGFLVFNTNDVRKQTRRIAEEALAYYEVTYVPPASPLDGSFRRIAVDVDRPKTSVQTRKGYFAVPSVPGVPMQSFEVSLFKELDAQPGRHDFSHKTAVVPLRAARDRVEVAILAEASLNDLQSIDDAAAGVCRIHGAMLAVIRDEKGAIVERFARDDPFQGPLNRKESYRSAPWLLEVRSTLAPGRYTLETVMADKQANRASIERHPFEIAKWTEGPHIAALTYVRGVSTASADSPRPFQSDGKAVDPAMDAKLPGGKGSSATVYFLASGTNGSPIRVEIAVSKDGHDVARGVLHEGPAKLEMPFVSTLDASSLPGGEYEVRVKAVQGEQSSVASLPLTIAPWSGPAVASKGAAVPEPEPVAVSARKPEEWIAAPPTEQQQRLLESARTSALLYAQSLPNFLCLQTTRRFEDPSGKQEWRQKDEYSEVLSWQNGVESYDQVGGRNRRKNKQTSEIRVSSAGEFGTVLKTIFQPEAKAEFRWLRSESVAGRSAEVFAYRIAQENSQYKVYYVGRHNVAVKPALRGIVTIDTRTAETLHLDLEVDPAAGKSPFADLKISIDYDTASVAAREFMLPSTATLTTRVGSRLLVRNEMRFSGYRRFDTETKIQYGDK